jgi:hypothetical protein
MAAKMVGPAYVVVADGVAAGVGGADIMSMRQAIGVGVDVVGFVAVGGLYVAMLADEEVMRLNLVVSALVAPKSLVALHGVVGEGDANCVEVVLTIDVVDEGVVVGVGGTGHMVMLQACDAGVDVPNSILVMVTIVGFVRG